MTVRSLFGLFYLFMESFYGDFRRRRALMRNKVLHPYLSNSIKTPLFSKYHYDVA